MHLRKMVSTFYKDHPEKPTAISALLDSALPMTRLIIQLLAKQKRGRSTGRVKKRSKWGDKEEATKKRWQGGIWVSAVLEPEVGGESEICLPDAESVGQHTVAVWPWAVRFLKNYTASYSDQFPYHPNSLSSKFFLEQIPPLSTNLGFSFLVLSLGWKIFSSTISTLMIFQFSFPFPSSVGRFFIDWSFVQFSSSVSHWVRRFFTSNMILWDSSAFLQD